MAGSARAGRAARLGFAAFLCAGFAVGGSAASAPAQASKPEHHGALAASSARRALAARYLAIAKAGNRRLDHDFDRLEGPDRDHLVRARADLRDIAATERLFDRRLARISFPPRIERVARSLYTSNQMRAALATAAVRSSSLRELHSYEQLLNAADSPVERAVRLIRRRLGLPPPPTS